MKMNAQGMFESWQGCALKGCVEGDGIVQSVIVRILINFFIIVDRRPIESNFAILIFHLTNVACPMEMNVQRELTEL